jgi:hypothetical protein
MINILWHVDPLLGSDREIGHYTAAVARQRPVNNNRGMVFSATVALEQRNGVFCVIPADML